MTEIKRIKCPNCKGVFAVQAEEPAAGIATNPEPDKVAENIGAQNAGSVANNPVLPASIICPYCAKTFDIAAA
jgi:hypothetical protein